LLNFKEMSSKRIKSLEVKLKKATTKMGILEFEITEAMGQMDCTVLFVV
jgi:hypothetical protein